MPNSHQLDEVMPEVLNLMQQILIGLEELTKHPVPDVIRDMMRPILADFNQSFVDANEYYLDWKEANESAPFDGGSSESDSDRDGRGSN